MSNEKRSFGNLIKNYGIVFVLIVVILFFGIANPSFATASNFITILTQVSVVCICSLGMMFVLLTGGIDLSVGWIISSVGMISAYCMVNLQMNVFASCLLAVAFALLVGLVEGLLIAKLKIPPFIVTMAFMNILKGFSFLMTSGKSIYGIPDSFKVIGQGKIGEIPIPVIIMFAAIFITWVIVSKTYFGRYFYAVGGNEQATRLSGVNTDMVKILTYVISAGFACLAGLVQMSRIATGAPNNGDGYEFDVITACCLGGVSMSGGSGKVYQVFVGAMIIAVLNNGLIILHVNTYIQLVLKGVILLLAVAYDCVQKNRA